MTAFSECIKHRTKSPTDSGHIGYDTLHWGPIFVREATMLAWTTISYGAALSALAGLILAFLVARERRPGTLAAVAVGAFAGPFAWNAILRTVNAPQFFVDALLPVFPVSWQDTGSGVFAFAALALLLGLGPLRSAPARRLVLLSGLGAVGALVVDVFLY